MRQGPVLAIDTSGEVAVAVVAPGEPAIPLAVRRTAQERRHAELLAPMITEALSEADVAPADLSAVVVGTGPAPFTGLRAGLVTARMLGVSLAIPVHGVCSLDVLAAQALAVGDVAEVLVVTDARRREVYAARYRAAADGDVVIVDGPTVQRPDALAAQVGEAVVVGPGTRLYPDSLGPAREPNSVDAVVLAGLGLRRAARGLDQPTEPLYLRRPDVTPALGRKRVTG